MDPARSNAGLFARRRDRAAALAQDAAELGTAFGLDLSLAPPAPPPPAAAPGWRSPAWMHRLARRSRGTA